MGKQKAPRKRPRNYDVGGGVMRFSSARMYKKHAVWKLKNKKAGRKSPKDKKRTESRMVTKEIGGDKNGKTRSPKSIPTEEMRHHLPSRKVPFSKQKNRHLRSGIKPGQILILLAGRHKGKHVVFLKQLDSGLLLVTGPYHLNGCPLRRINQIYVIATKTRLDISSLKVPERLNDPYFKRKNLKAPKTNDGEIFDTKKETYQVSDERKEDQLAVDTQVLDLIRKHPERKYMFGYLGSMFSLKNHQFPHKMVF